MFSNGWVDRLTRADNIVELLIIDVTGCQGLLLQTEISAVRAIGNCDGPFGSNHRTRCPDRGSVSHSLSKSRYGFIASAGHLRVSSEKASDCW
jgi:hypothetical protein